MNKQIVVSAKAPSEEGIGLRHRALTVLRTLVETLRYPQATPFCTFVLGTTPDGRDIFCQHQNNARSLQAACDIMEKAGASAIVTVYASQVKVVSTPDKSDPMFPHHKCLVVHLMELGEVHRVSLYPVQQSDRFSHILGEPLTLDQGESFVLPFEVARISTQQVFSGTHSLN